MNQTQTAVRPKGQGFDNFAAKRKGEEIVVEQHCAVWSLIEHPCGCTEERVTRFVQKAGRYVMMLSELHPCEQHIGGNWK